ncbi:MAG: PDDEXK nuclease domain-containing protein [Acidobacteria bacterium]|nr:PDDEXK nuclease domain-containing protein [Acidobacteriota bacterium]
MNTSNLRSVGSVGGIEQEKKEIYISDNLYNSIKIIIDKARNGIVLAVNTAMVETYWHIGQLMVEDEQKGENRAEYGKLQIEGISQTLTLEFGKGYSIQNLWNMRQFYQKFSSMQRELKVNNDKEILSALRRELSWSHYKILMRVEKPQACIWYMNESADQNWSTRALERQINSFYYERLLLSKDKKPVFQEAYEKTNLLKQSPIDFLKNPYVLEFLDLNDKDSFRESELEQAIIEKLQEFLLELGKGFAFVARQKRISTETKEFYIDLVFYNYHLKCFVLIDLKTGELTHQDVGQMEMYVRMFDDLQRGKDDNPTVGLILCTEKDKAIVKYSVLNEYKQLFASKYMLYLPSEDELIMELEREKRLIKEEWAIDSEQPRGGKGE